MEVTLRENYRKEFWDYYDNIFLKKYPHIFRCCELIKDKYQPIIFDVGGGTGTTMEIFRRELPKSNIYCFEPIKENYEEIRLKFGVDGDRFHLYNEAVGDYEGETAIHLSENITSSSIHNPAPDQVLGTELSKSIKSSKTQKIKIVKLEPYIEKITTIDLLKLDVQGYELEALRGIGNSIAKIRYIVLEVSNHHAYAGGAQYYEIDEYLRSKGFTVNDLFPGIRENGILLEWDSIYVNKAFD